MLRPLFSSFLVLAVTLPSIAAARPDKPSPPLPNIGSLAEQLAPLIKANPTLPQQKAPASQSRNQTYTEADTTDFDNQPPSPVEEAFSQRAGQELRLFGHNQIGRYLSEAPTTGQVQDDVILGTGDKVTVTFRGQRDDSKTYTITPQGELIVKGLDPITASGLTVGALRDRLENEAARSLSNSTVFLSVRSLRQISVTVMGEVTQPGIFTLSPFQTVLDAVTMAQGISKNGSLRQVKLLRGGKAVALDFYNLLLQGDLGAPIQLRDGDKIIVPVLGQTVAIAGDVKRPGIYERPPSGTQGAFDFQQVLQLAGGPLRPGANRYVRMTLNAWGDERVSDLGMSDRTPFSDGDLLMVTGGMPLRTNAVTVMGNIRQPGPMALNKVPDLKALLNHPRVLDDRTYPLIGVIERLDGKTLMHQLLAFSPVAVLQGKENRPLNERDRILFFSHDDIRHVMNKKTDKDEDRDQAQMESAHIPTDTDTLQALRKPDEIAVLNDLLTPQIIDFLHDRAIAVNGAVLQPGLYPVAGKPSLEALLKAAGGLKPDAEKNHIDILSGDARQTISTESRPPATVTVAAKDKITVVPKYTAMEKRGVELIGEVQRPGIYTLQKGDTLFDLIERAGGLTEWAAPKATHFMRESERLKQEEQFRNAARQLDIALAGYFLKQENDKQDKTEITEARKIARELRAARALGRIVVQADPDILREHPGQAILLQQGDRVFIPRRSPTVAVAGEVLSPASLQHRPGLSARDYIQMAGGTTKLADNKRGFVIFPDGSASSISGATSWFGRGNIPAGSTIIVPRDVKPLDTLRLTEGIANILSQVTITSMAILQMERDSRYFY